jgi:malate dehydrogenase (oxaloacetate-decarboxylating)
MTDAIKLHEKLKGKIEIKGKLTLNKKNLSLLYTPGVAQASKEIANNKKRAYNLTSKHNSLAIVSDGTRVLGLGDIGPEAAMPVMEGKALIWKEFGNVDAIPLCIGSKDKNEIIKFCEMIEPTFGGINIEDIDSPKCFEIVDFLTDKLNIPVFHDDQHGTGIVTLAALLNSLWVTKRNLKVTRIVIAGAGAAGMGIAKMLHWEGAGNIIICDSKGSLYRGRDGMNGYKDALARMTIEFKGSLQEAIQHADVFIGTSGIPDLITADDVRLMKKNPIVFALSNPNPEISPQEATRGGAKIIATGRSDYPNQVNNALVFPGFFRGLFDSGAQRVTREMMLAAAHAIASTIKPKAKEIVPSIFNKKVHKNVAHAVRECA